MTMPQSEEWYVANRNYLAAALTVVRGALEKYTGRVAVKTPPEPPQKKGAKAKTETNATPTLSDLRASAAAQSPPFALESLRNLFGLTDFETALLLACAAIELDGGFAALCAAAQGDARHAYPTFGLGLAAFPEAHWSALSPQRPLRRWHALEVAAGEGLTAAPLHIDERVLHYLVGVDYPDQRLQGLFEPLPLPDELTASQRDLAARMAAAWANAEDAMNCPIVQLCGNDQSGKRVVAAAACAVLGIELRTLRMADLPAAASERELLARLLEREALLSRSAFLIDIDELEGGETTRRWLPFLESVQGIVIINGAQPLAVKQRPLLRCELNRPGVAEQKRLWRQALGPVCERLNGELELVATQFNLGAQAVRAAGTELLRHVDSAGEKEIASLLWDLCRAQARPRLDDLAQRIEPAAAWEDFVLPPIQMQILRTIAAHVRRRDRVYEGWGFAGRGTRGLGISALFSGPTGTGKTMAAEVLANELRLDLYRIDLSALVSKYVGDTEKNLRRVFDAAEEGGAILLFDEADALFGKRSEVKDSHDRYANIEVSYLLQRVESYRGLAILTTNLKNALDPAFLRRIRFIVHFPFPDAAQRAEIWRRIFPPQTPTEGLDLEKLAQLNLSGGNIRNLALNAAFLAAEEGGPVRMSHLLIAAQGEYAKLEKALTETEIEDWA